MTPDHTVADLAARFGSPPPPVREGKTPEGLDLFMANRTIVLGPTFADLPVHLQHANLAWCVASKARKRVDALTVAAAVVALIVVDATLLSEVVAIPVRALIDFGLYCGLMILFIRLRVYAVDKRVLAVCGPEMVGPMLAHAMTHRPEPKGYARLILALMPSVERRVRRLGRGRGRVC